MIEYKPCPFCGSKEISMYWYSPRNEYYCFAHIECDVCGCKTKNFYEPRDYDKVIEMPFEEAHSLDSYMKAVAAWNRRTDGNTDT